MTAGGWCGCTLSLSGLTLFFGLLVTLAHHHEGNNAQNQRHCHCSADNDHHLFLAAAFSFRFCRCLFFLGHVILREWIMNSMDSFMHCIM